MDYNNISFRIFNLLPAFLMSRPEFETVDWCGAIMEWDYEQHDSYIEAGGSVCGDDILITFDSTPGWQFMASRTVITDLTTDQKFTYKGRLRSGSEEDFSAWLTHMKCVHTNF